MKSLLNKPLKVFIAFASITLVCSIPAYFFLVEYIWMEELDDHNQLIVQQIHDGFNKVPSEELDKSIELWNKVHPESTITPLIGISKDSVYIVEKNKLENGISEVERFRGLRSSIELNQRRYQLLIETNVEEVHETMWAITLVTCFFIMLLIIGFVLLSRYLSKTIWQPFTNTLATLKHFDLNSSEKPGFETTNIKEFSELHTVLTKLIENNIRVFNEQKEFTENASHELQTPLAILKSKIDLLVQDGTLSNEQRQIIEAVDNSILRMTRINKNLLLLSRIESKDYDVKKINLSVVLRQQLDNFSDFVENKNCSVETYIQPTVCINANESLVEILLSNMISNAIRYSNGNREIVVTLNSSQFIIINSGPQALDEHKLFKRFISVSPESAGTGLGLAIIKQIADKYNWKITYQYQQSKHIFSLSL